MTIRALARNEVPALGALARQTYSDAFGHSFLPSDLEAYLRDALSDSYFERAFENDTFLVAHTHEQMIGFAQFGDLVSPIGSASKSDQEIRRIYVLKRFQNNGIGRKLMDAALTHPRLKQAPTIYLDVWERNDGARRLYERYGFVVIGAKSLLLASGVASDRDLIMVRRVKPD